MKANLLGIDLVAKKATIVDSGDEPFSATNLDPIGKAVASILKKPEDTANKYFSEHYQQIISLHSLQHPERPTAVPIHGSRTHCIVPRVYRHRKPLT